MPELLEPLFPPFKLGESSEVGLLDAEALLVMTREMVLLPLTVSIVVVTTGAAPLSLASAAVVVIKAVWLCTGVEDSGVGVGVSLVRVGVADVEGSSVVDAGVDDDAGAGDDGGRELAVTCDDRVADAEAEFDVTAELEAAADEPAVPTGLLWPWRLCRCRCASASAAQTAEMMTSTRKKTDGILDMRRILMKIGGDC